MFFPDSFKYIWTSGTPNSYCVVPHVLVTPEKTWGTLNCILNRHTKGPLTETESRLISFQPLLVVYNFGDKLLFGLDFT